MDSRIGAQLSVHPTPRLRAVVQVVSEHDGSDSFEPEVEWANLQYDLSPSLSVRAGRIAVGASLASDYRKVGFAIPWVRPPAEVYRMLPITHSDGLDLTYSMHRGEVSYRAQASWGSNETSFVDAEGWGLYQTLDWRALTLQLSCIRVDLEIPATAPLFEAIEQFGPEGRAIAERYDSEEAPFVVMGGGVSYDPGSWFVMAEYAELRSDSVYGDSSAWYVSAGPRLGSVVPFVTLARGERGHSSRVEGLTVAAYPPPLAPVAAGLNGVLQDLRRSTADQRTMSIGGRWDAASNIAVKVQYDVVDVTDGSPGTFTNLEPGFQPGRVNVFSVGVDFLF